MQLEPAERALLADHLLQSLENTEILEAWVEESERRLKAFENEEIQSHDSDEVLAKLRSKIR